MAGSCDIIRDNLVSTLCVGVTNIVFGIDNPPVYQSTFILFTCLPTLKMTLRLSALEFSIRTYLVILQVHNCENYLSASTKL